MQLSFKHVVAVAGSVLALSSQATTVTFNNPGESYSFIYSASVDGADLLATVTYTLKSTSGKTAVFGVSAFNQSTGIGKGPIPNRMVAFGIALVNPDLDKANVAGVGEWNAAIDQVFPGDTVVDLCEYAGSNCLDDTGQGVQAGAPADTFDLTLKFVSNVGQNPISFSSPFESKWQGVGDSRLMYAVTGCLAGTDCISEVSQIPEPTSLALGGLALLGAFAARRRSA